jgi:LysM repeat protein
MRTPQVRYYKVRPGDTLTEIASRNGTTVSQLCQLNGIKPTSVLQVGRSLRVK